MAEVTSTSNAPETLPGPLTLADEFAPFQSWEKFPPWLGSVVFHLSLVIVLVLTVSQAMGPPKLTPMVVELGNNAGGGGSEGELEKLTDLGSPLSDVPEQTLNVAEQTAPLQVDPLAHEAELVSDISSSASKLDISQMPDFGSMAAGSLGDGGGTGGGHGRGVGTGIGDGSGPGIGQTSMFNLIGEGRKFVYVFDRSESMNSVFTLYNEDAIVRQVSPLMLAKAELMESLGKLASHHQFQIVFYNHDHILFGGGYSYSDMKLFPATTENKQAAKEFVEAIPGEGNTNHWDALQAALALRPDVIFLITDGEAKDDPPLHQVQSMAKFCKRKHIQINVIHFSNVNRPYCTLIPLAETTRGQHIFIDLQTFVQSQNK